MAKPNNVLTELGIKQYPIWEPKARTETVTFFVSNGEEDLVTYRVSYDSTKSWPQTAVERSLTTLRDQICKRWLFLCMPGAAIRIETSSSSAIWTHVLNLGCIEKSLDAAIENVRDYLKGLVC